MRSSNHQWSARFMLQDGKSIMSWFFSAKNADEADEIATAKAKEMGATVTAIVYFRNPEDQPN